MKKSTAYGSLIVALGAIPEGGSIPLPERLVVCPWGESKALDGSKVIVNETTAAVLAANQGKIGHNEVCLDFNHNTFAGFDETGKVVKPQEPVKVASYGSLSVVPGEGIVFTPANWTTEGSEFFQGGHYKDLSPVVLRNDKGEVVAIHSIALCRQGQIADLHAYSSATDPRKFLKLSADDAGTQTNPTNTTTMDYKELLIALLGLDPASTDEQITAACAAAGEKAKAMACAHEPDKKEAIAMAARLDELERGIILDGAARDGKIIPLSADAVKELPLATLKTLVGGLKAGQVPIGNAAATAAKAAETKTVTALGADDKEVCRQLGISEEQYRKGMATA